jgi:hypothetical protein
MRILESHFHKAISNKAIFSLVETSRFEGGWLDLVDFYRICDVQYSAGTDPLVGNILFPTQPEEESNYRDHNPSRYYSLLLVSPVRLSR